MSAAQEMAAARAEMGEPGLGAPARSAVMALTLFGLVLVVHQLFNLRAFGLVLIEGRYLYILGGTFLAVAYLTFRADGSKGHPPGPAGWLLAASSLGATAYLAATAQANLSQGWEYAAPEEAVQIFHDIGARQALGFHWGTFQLTDEPREEPRELLAAAREAAGIPAHRFVAFAPGEVHDGAE